jgi:hypothetical protein
MSAPFPKKCSCGRSHTRAEWDALPLCGVMELIPGERLEMRNCPCRSTIAVDSGELESEEVMDIKDSSPDIGVPSTRFDRDRHLAALGHTSERLQSVIDLDTVGVRLAIAALKTAREVVSNPKATAIDCDMAVECAVAAVCMARMPMRGAA